eukprot:1151553-Pelagomonas_calceolata.AAC.2
MVGETAQLIKEDARRTLFHHQVQYYTHFAPMIIEKWALPFFKKAGLQPATTSTAARTDIECACCQVCNCHGGYEPKTSEPHTLTCLSVMSANVRTTGPQWFRKCMK